MTEPDWLTSTDWTRHVRHVWPAAGERRRRLLAAGFCRSAWHLFGDPDLRAAVAAAERFADGDVSVPELERHRRRCRVLAVQANEEFARRADADPAAAVPHYRLRQVAWVAAYVATGPVPAEDIGRRVAEAAAEIEVLGRFADGDTVLWGVMTAADRLPAAENEALRGVVFDLFGNPFRPAAVAPAWRTAAAVGVARAAYESGDFSGLPILADALQDAGCEDAAVLDHCRGPGPHYRGCWVVDGVLGRA